MTDIVIFKKNDVFIQIECEDSIAYELEDFFTFFVPGYRFMPKFKNKMWDGKIRLFSIWTREVYSGLTDYIIEFANQHDYSISLAPGVRVDSKIKPQHIAELCSILNIHSGGKKIIAHDYQMTAIYHALKKKRAILLSPTSSGKSLIIYTIIRYLQQMMNKKILIIVPTVSLVSQMASDFADYSSEVSWDAEANVHKISSGQNKFSEKDIIVSTWQSVFRMGPSYFEQFGALIVDECLSAGTQILMADNTTKNIEDIIPGDVVLTMNEKTHENESNEVKKLHTNLMVSSDEEMYEIVTETGKKIEITGNHKVYTQDGWKRADELVLDDCINSIN